MTRRHLIAGAAVAQLRSSERELLDRVAEAYKGAATAYEAVARQFATTGGPLIGGTITPVKRQLQTSNGFYRLENDIGDRWIFVRGERESWIYRSDRREYRQGANASDVAVHVERFVYQAHHDLGKKFALLRSLTGDVQVTGEQQIKVAGRKTRCTVLSIKPTAEQWTEKLWIDPATALVWKSVLDTPESARRLSRTQTTEWQQIAVGATFPSDTFVFTPPKNARRVEAFSNVPIAEPPPLQLPYP